jgi:hypothetical protein
LYDIGVFHVKLPSNQQQRTEMLKYQAINSKEQNPILHFKLNTIRRMITAATCQHQLTLGDKKIQKYILVSLTLT